VFDDDETIIASLEEPSTDSDGMDPVASSSWELTQPGVEPEPRGLVERVATVRSTSRCVDDPDADFVTLDESPRTRTSPGVTRKRTDAPSTDRGTDGSLPYEETQFLRRRVPREAA